MATVNLPLRATDELVAAAWIATIPGLNRDMVGSQLPPDANEDGSQASWVGNDAGFVQVAVVGGTSDPLLPVKRPVMQVDCWATLPGSNYPPWTQANRLAETIQYATWDRYNIARPLTITLNGVVYPAAVVQSAYLTTRPRRITDDAGDYARYSFDLALQWVTVDDRLD
jgi:hypothetical protein